jgi:hypothetical protein
LPLVPENHKRLLLGRQLEIVQDYRWVKHIAYEDSQKRLHNLNMMVCQENKSNRHGDPSTTTFKGLTHFILTHNNVDILANQGGRLRWTIENEASLSA